MPANSGAITGTIAHKHSAPSADGGFLDDNVTGVTGTANGSLVMFDGSSIAQDLPAGNNLDVLTMGAAVPAWTAAAPASSVWQEIADVTLGVAGQLSASFAAHDMLDIWVLGANTAARNTTITFNNSVAANYKNNNTIDDVYASNTGNTEIPIDGSNHSSLSYIHLNAFYDTTSTETGFTWQGMNFQGGSGNLPKSYSGWGYYYGAQITQIDKSLYGAVANDQQIGARMVVLGAN